MKEWILVVDPSSGEEYYYNKRTNESSWDKVRGEEKLRAEKVTKHSAGRAYSECR